PLSSRTSGFPERCARDRSMNQSEEIVDNPDEGVGEHIREYVATDGRRGQWLPGWKAPTLLLVTRGRRSGKPRRRALRSRRGGRRRQPGSRLVLEPRRGSRGTGAGRGRRIPGEDARRQAGRAT